MLSSSCCNNTRDRLDWVGISRNVSLNFPQTTQASHERNRLNIVVGECVEKVKGMK